MKSVNIVLAIGASVALGLSSVASAGVVTGGNLVVFQSGDGAALTSNAPFSILELTRTAGQVAPVQTFDISGQLVNPLYTSSTATSTGYLSLSQNRGSVQFDAHTSRAAGTGNNNTVTGRGVGSINTAGNYSMIGSYTGNSGSQARSAGLMNNGDLFIGDQGGFYISGGTSTVLNTNVRNIRSFGSTAYVFQASATTPVSSIAGTPGAPVLSALPGLTGGANFQDFYLLSSANDGNFDLAYFATTTGVSKFQLVSGTWASRGTATISGGFFGIAAELNPTGGIGLYLTTGSGAINGNSVKKFIDSSAPGASIALDAGSTLFTAPTGYTIKGIELAPIPTPGTCGLLALGGLLAARRRR